MRLPHMPHLSVVLTAVPTLPLPGPYESAWGLRAGSYAGVATVVHGGLRLGDFTPQKWVFAPAHIPATSLRSWTSEWDPVARARTTLVLPRPRDGRFASVIPPAPSLPLGRANLVRCDMRGQVDHLEGLRRGWECAPCPFGPGGVPRPIAGCLVRRHITG